MKDYHQILGVSVGASQDEIKRAFRILAHRWHPDKQGGDEKKFKEINEAYQILSGRISPPEQRPVYQPQQSHVIHIIYPNGGFFWGNGTGGFYTNGF